MQNSLSSPSGGNSDPFPAVVSLRGHLEKLPHRQIRKTTITYGLEGKKLD